MTTFDGRDKAFEDKFAHDAELQFKVTARRNKLFGLWAAARLGMSGDAASNYAREVIAADFIEAGDNDIIGKVLADLTAGGIAVSDRDVRVALEAQALEARRQFMEAG